MITTNNTITNDNNKPINNNKPIGNNKPLALSTSLQISSNRKKKSYQKLQRQQSLTTCDWSLLGKETIIPTNITNDKTTITTKTEEGNLNATLKRKEPPLITTTTTTTTKMPAPSFSRTSSYQIRKKGRSITVSLPSSLESKNLAVMRNGYKIDIMDTPGHADFG